jgi:hypothetical protein
LTVVTLEEGKRNDIRWFPGCAWELIFARSNGKFLISYPIIAMPLKRYKGRVRQQYLIPNNYLGKPAPTTPIVV